MAAMTAVALSSSPLLPPLPSKSNPSPPPPPPPFPPLFHIPFPSPSPHIACSRLSSRPPPSTRFHHSISPKAAPRRPNRLLCRAAEYKLPDPIPEFAAAETNKFRTHMLDRLTKKNEYFGDSFGEVVDTCTENNGLVSMVYNKPFPKPLHFNARNPLTRVGMSAGATSSSSSRRLHLYPPTFCSSNSLLSPNPPLLLSSLLPAAFRAPPLAVNYGRLGSASSKWGSDGFWEDPDDGNDSEPEEMDEEEEEEISSDEGEAEASAVDNDKSAMFQYEDLVKEVELLLEPEERVILQKNEVPDVSKISTMKWNPFHSLALSGQIPFMDKLLEHGTEIDCLDKDGFTALHKAVIGKKEAVISHLLRKGANPHVRDRDGATPLHYAVQVGAMQTVKLLIKYKVDVNVADNDGWMPLHVAMQTRSREIAKVLLVNGADKTRRNKDGKTPLDLSLCFGKDFKSYELAKLLKLVPVNKDP